MEYLNNIKLSRDIINILSSRYSTLFIQNLNKLYDNYNFTIEVINIDEPIKKCKIIKIFNQTPWLTIYNNIVNNFQNNVPIFVQKYMEYKSRDVFFKLKSLSKRHHLNFKDMIKSYIKLINKFQLNNTNKILLMTSKNSNNLLKPEKFKNIKLERKGHSNYSLGLINLIESEEEESAKKRFETHLDVIKKNNKVNIYVGEFETLSKAQFGIEKIKIYEGKMCSSFFVNKNQTKSSESTFRGDLRKAIKKDGGIFIPTNVSKAKQMEYVMNKFTDVSHRDITLSNTSRIFNKRLKFNSCHFGDKNNLTSINLNPSPKTPSNKIFKFENDKTKVATNFSLKSSYEHSKNQTFRLSKISHEDNNSLNKFWEENSSHRKMNTCNLIKPLNLRHQILNKEKHLYTDRMPKINMFNTKKNMGLALKKSKKINDTIKSISFLDRDDFYYK